MKLKTGNPPERGVDVVHVYAMDIPDYVERIFASWHGGRWWYHLSTQPMRRTVIGFVGPLPPVQKKRKP